MHMRWHDQACETMGLSNGPTSRPSSPRSGGLEGECQVEVRLSFESSPRSGRWEAAKGQAPGRGSGPPRPKAYHLQPPTKRASCDAERLSKGEKRCALEE